MRCDLDEKLNRKLISITVARRRHRPISRFRYLSVETAAGQIFEVQQLAYKPDVRVWIYVPLDHQSVLGFRRRISHFVRSAFDLFLKDQQSLFQLVSGNRLT